jgi:hypothetical protein
MKRVLAGWAACGGLLLATAPALADETFCPDCYAGLRLGSSRSFVGSGLTTAELNQQGYGVSADVHSKSLGGGAYVGYEFMQGLAAEAGYLRLGSGTTSLRGTVMNSAAPVLQATSSDIAGYGNAALLDLRLHLRLVSKLFLDTREGLYWWESHTNVSGIGTQSHSGLGESLGIGLSYRLWRGLEAGAGADIYRSNSDNRFVQFTGQLEWRFGRG